MEKLDMLFVHPPANTNGVSHTLDADTNFTEQYVSIPTGVFSMADNLEKVGYRVRILNLGERIHLSGDTLEHAVRKMLSQFQPTFIGIDCHWMIHSAGAIKTAEIIHRHAPYTYIVFGGITASLFAEEIISLYPFVKYVLRGECDSAIVKLLDSVIRGIGFTKDVANLSMRKFGTVRSIIHNPIVLPDVESTLETARYDLLADPPRINPDRALITMFRGCKRSCCYCAGGKQSFGKVMERNTPCIISPERVAELMKKNLRHGRNKLYLYGDIRHGGKQYVNRFFQALDDQKITNAHIVFEFFSPATLAYVHRWKIWADENHCTLEATYSPDSGSQKVRSLLGKGYSNKKILDHCRLVASSGIPQSTYFMFGLPGQDLAEVEETLSLAEEIIKIYVSAGFNRTSLRHDVIAYTFMQIPDAGSELFQNPEKYGFRLNFKDFAGLVKLLSSAKNWTQAIGYSTENFTPEQLAQTYCMIMDRMKLLYEKYGL